MNQVFHLDNWTWVPPPPQKNVIQIAKIKVFSIYFGQNLSKVNSQICFSLTMRYPPRHRIPNTRVQINRIQLSDYD